MTTVAERPKPFLFPQFCKGCGRCIEACPKDCITLGTEINPQTGLVPVVLDLERCNGCGLCFTIGCPAISKTAADQAEIDQLLCASCDLCAQVCARGAIQPRQAP